MSKEGTLWILCVLVWYSVGNLAWAGGIDYDSCRSLEEIISKESEEIASTHFSNHITWAQLYISRGESYLLSAKYEKALGFMGNTWIFKKGKILNKSCR